MNTLAKRRIALGGLLLGCEALLFVFFSQLLQLNTQLTVMLLLMYIVILASHHHYDFSPVLIWQEMTQLIQAHVLYICLVAIISLFYDLSLIVKIVILSAVMYVLNIWLERFFRHRMKNNCATSILVFGAGKGAESMRQIFMHNGFLMVSVLGYVNLESLTGEPLSEETEIRDHLIALEDVDAFLQHHLVEQVLIVDDQLTSEQSAYLKQKIHPQIPVIKYRPKSAFIQPYNTKVEDFDGNLFVSVSNPKKRHLDLLLKRCLDIAIGMIGCVALIPISLIVKILYLISGDRASIFFTQQRVGKDGRLIKIYKYRSMVPDAEALLEAMMAADPAIKEAYLTEKKLDPDPRVTPVGKILRRTSVDEFPQFINVLKGEMSFIGPRPYLPREIPDMKESYETIIKSKPGITGMWQVSGRNDVGFQERCALDVYYDDNWSIWLDFIIMVKTIKVVVKREGAK